MSSLQIDQIDNDSDGATDKQDSDCNVSGFDTSQGKVFLNPEAVCDDGKDNDGDGATDMNDNDCVRVIDVPANRTSAPGDRAKLIPPNLDPFGP